MMTYFRPMFSGRALALPLIAAIFGCSGGDLVLPQPQPGAELHLAVVSGDEQTGTVGQPLPKPLVVEVHDEQGHAIVGREVAFVVVGGPSSAELTPDTAVTNGAGQAVGQWVLGTSSGAYTAEARVVAAEDDAPDIDLPTVPFIASAKSAEPDTLRAESRLDQAGRRNQEVNNPPVVRVLDRYGNPVSGAAVRWEVTAGKGKVSAPVVLTGADGRATVTWTLGGNIGVQKLAASVQGGVYGSPIVFTVTVLP